MTWKRLFAAMLVTLMIGSIVVNAADFKQMMSDTESRKRAAESGLKEIRSKGQPSDDIVRAYADAATQQNAWLDTVCQAVEQGAAGAPDVSASAQRAAESLVAWVSVRNRALGQPELSGPVADGVKKSIVQDLTEIASTTWKNNRSADPKKRANAAKTLRDQLHWKAVDEL